MDCHQRSTRIAALIAVLLPATAAGQEVEIHGFASEGGFVSTDNDYIGKSSRGTVELFEAGLNVSSELGEGLRAGLQLFSRNVGDLDDAAPRLDWAFLDYRFRPWLGLRAGVIRMPLGLYNEYVDVDSARLPILMPQAVYPIHARDVVLSHTGFALYGERSLGAGGALEYQAWLGSLSIPRNALQLDGATLDGVDTRYVVGAQLFWQLPVEGLRVGGTYLRNSIDFELTLSQENVEALVAAGLVPEDYDGKLVVSQRPNSWWVASFEYQRADWLFAGEYSRWLKHQQTSLPMVLPSFDEDGERFYALATYRVSAWLETGLYYSVSHADVGDRLGEGEAWEENFHAFQRDLAATLRFDVSEHWLWKLEGHFIDGTLDLRTEGGRNPTPERYWGLFLLRTTVWF